MGACTSSGPKGSPESVPGAKAEPRPAGGGRPIFRKAGLGADGDSNPTAAPGRRPSPNLKAYVDASVTTRSVPRKPRHHHHHHHHHRRDSGSDDSDGWQEKPEQARRPRSNPTTIQQHSGGPRGGRPRSREEGGEVARLSGGEGGPSGGAAPAGSASARRPWKTFEKRRSDGSGGDHGTSEQTVRTLPAARVATPGGDAADAEVAHLSSLPGHYSSSDVENDSRGPSCHSSDEPSDTGSRSDTGPAATLVGGGTATATTTTAATAAKFSPTAVTGPAGTSVSYSQLKKNLLRLKAATATAPAAPATASSKTVSASSASAVSVPPKAPPAPVLPAVCATSSAAPHTGRPKRASEITDPADVVACPSLTKDSERAKRYLALGVTVPEVGVPAPAQSSPPQPRARRRSKLSRAQERRVGGVRRVKAGKKVRLTVAAAAASNTPPRTGRSDVDDEDLGKVWGGLPRRVSNSSRRLSPSSQRSSHSRKPFSSPSSKSTSGASQWSGRLRRRGSAAVGGVAPFRLPPSRASSISSHGSASPPGRAPARQNPPPTRHQSVSTSRS